MSDKQEWKAGDVVQLQAGGPRMMVQNRPAISARWQVYCQWFDSNGTKHTDHFDPESLVKAFVG